MTSPKYILTERVAVGGMAEIHLGKSVGSDGFARICAFKKILPHYASDNEFIQMFRNEANLAKQLLNKNIVQVYDFVADGESYMLVMEYVDGQDLRSVLQLAEKTKKRIPIELACYIAIETLSGLAYAHGLSDLSGKSLGIIHRDVSPQNVLISFEGDVKITDFGIAKVQSQNSHTRAGVLKGKFSYMSPEQASGEAMDARSDIYSVGIVLYEMLTMTRLYKGEDLSIIAQVRESNVTPPSKVKDSSIPFELEQCVMKLLEKNPQKRYQSARDAVKELSKFLYSYRPDFFAGELGEFMQVLFQEKIEQSKARMRSTLALPFGSMGPGHGGIRITTAHEAAKPLYGNVAPKAGVAPADSDVTKARNPTPDGRRKGGDRRHPARPPVAEVRPSAQNQKARVARPQNGLDRALNKVASQSTPVVVMMGLGAVVSLFLLFAAARKLRAAATQSEFEIQLTPNVRATIEVDGAMLFAGSYQDNPLRLHLASGEHTVVIRRPGFKPKKLKLEAGFFSRKTTETVTLSREGALGQMRVNTVPSGAVVVLEDGMESGVAPETFRYLATGRTYEFRISHPKCDALVTREFLPSSAEKSPFSRVFHLRNCSR